MLNRVKSGVRCGDLAMSFKSIFQDVRNAVDYVHIHGDLKKKTIENLDLYLKKDERLPMFLARIRESGAKLFILTNSDYNFTDKIMSYLFDFPHGAKVNLTHSSHACLARQLQCNQFSTKPLGIKILISLTYDFSE